MQNCFSSCDCGQEASNGKTVGLQGCISCANQAREVQSVSFEECLAEELAWNVQANVFEVVGRREVMLAQLVDVECELNLYVRVRILGVIYRWAILFFELRKLNGNGMVNRAAVSNGVSDVVGKGTNREGEFVRRLRVV